MNSPQPPRVAPPEIPEDSSTATAVEEKKVSRPLLTALVIAILVFVVSSVADLIMLYEHEPVRRTIEISDAISALVIGSLSYHLIRLQHQRRERLRQRVAAIADMNHHVRNALQVISLSFHGKSQDEISAIRESVNRIQWALRELLPKI
jgi:hypothetical protein